MPEVTNELMFEALVKVHADTGEMKFNLHEIKKRFTCTEEAIAGVNRRLDRIERQLDLRELAEAQQKYDPDK